MREFEGANLQTELKAHLATIAKEVTKVAELSQDSVLQLAERLRKRVQELLDSEIDQDRLAQEVAILADRLDISEEVARFSSHVSHFNELANESNSGKKLEFLLQEMGREINTIGSKSQSTQIANIVITVKAELEKLREQIQNIE